MEFINPYNFISLSNTIQREDVSDVNKKEKEAAANGELLSGSISYKVKTRSPLFIPNTSANQVFKYTDYNKDDDPDMEHKLQDFYSYEDLSEYNQDNPLPVDRVFSPIIPGSEVRGMLRSIYETLTDSCMVAANDKGLISRRTVEHFLPGLLVKTTDAITRKAKIQLYAAKEYIYRDSDDFRVKKNEECNLPDCCKVTFHVDNTGIGRPRADSVKEVKTNEKGYLLKGAIGPDMSPTGRSCNSDKCVNFKNGTCPRSKNPDAKLNNCWLAEKHCAHIFAHKGTPELISVSNMDDAIKRLDVVLVAYDENAKQDKDKAKKDYNEYRKAYDKFIASDEATIPVYYSVFDDRKVMFSPACITREVYETTPAKLMDVYHKCGHKFYSNQLAELEKKAITAKKDGELVAKYAKHRNGLCPACRLFGQIGTVGNQEARGSKIRFADLSLDPSISDSDAYESELATLQELASPKPANAEFYLRPDVVLNEGEELWFWTYDYYTVKKTNGDIEVRRFDSNQLQISGRKFYWNRLTPPKKDAVKTNRNKTVRLVKAETLFTGKVYFDGITQKQFDQLMYVLKFTSNEKHCFKLGGGKPLGLGSVQLYDVEASVRTMVNGCYAIIPWMESTVDYCELGFDVKVKRAFEMAARILSDRDDKRVAYPLAKSSDGTMQIFAWFAKNKTSYRKENKENRLKAEFDGTVKTDKSPKSRVQTKYVQTLGDVSKDSMEQMVLYENKRETITVASGGKKASGNHNKTDNFTKKGNWNKSGNKNHSGKK